MENNINQNLDNIKSFLLSKMLYEKEPVFFTASKFIDDFFIKIEPYGENSIIIYYKSKNDDYANTSLFEDKFCNMLIQEQALYDLQKKFGHLRDMIVEQAFYPVENK